MAFCNGCKHLCFIGYECNNIVYIAWLKEKGKFRRFKTPYIWNVNEFGRCPAWERPWWAFWRKPLEPVPEDYALDEAEKIIRRVQ